MPYILGLNAYHPDSSAALIKDGKLIAAVEEERFNRVKHWSGFPTLSIQYCLNVGAVTPDMLDCICINRNTQANFVKKIIYAIKKRPSF